MVLVGIEEVAKVNHLELTKTSRPGQYKAHCPACGDQGHQYHLYVSANKDAFYCQKCGSKGGAIAFHAWLKGVDYITAQNELYPEHQRRPVHPAERLTPEQLAKIGFVPKRLPRKAPAGWDQKKWNTYRSNTLSYIWREWCAYERLNKEQTTRLFHLLTNTEINEAM